MSTNRRHEVFNIEVIISDCSWLRACVDKLALKSTILPATSVERHASVNGHQTFPGDVTSSSRDTYNGVIAGRCTGYRQETVTTPSLSPPPSRDEQSSVEVSQSPPTIKTGYVHYQHHQLRDDVISSQSTPSCDVTRPTTETSVDSTASSSLSSAASSSFMTSSLDVDDDVIDDDGTLRRRPSGAGSALLRAHARLSAVVSQLLRLAIDDDDSSQQAAIDVDRLLRRVLPEPETVSATPTESIFELLDEVIIDCGLDVAIKILLDGLTRARHSSTGSHLGHVIELLRAVELLATLVTSLDSVDSEVRNYGCTCDVMRTDDVAEFDVQLTSSSDCVTDDATLSRRLRQRHSGGRANDSHFRSRRVAAYDDDDSFDHHLAALSVRLTGWCVCDRRRTVPLARLLTDTRCVCELALTKINLDTGLTSWLAEALRFNTSLVRLDLRLSSLGESDAAAALGNGLSRHRRMRTLNLAGTGLTDTCLCRLLNALSTNRKLAELDVGFNDLATGSGCLALGEVLRTRRPPLRRLRMREDGITWSKSTVAPFFRSTARSSRLRCLDVSGNALADDGVSQLSETLLVNRTLRELNIEYCQFGQRGCIALARALRSNDALRSLQMSRNAVGDDGFSEIVGALRYNRAVTSLGANQCHVGNVGLAHLLDALRHNVTVTLVKLCYNDIGRFNNDQESPDRRRRRDWVGIHMTSCSSLQVIKDDVIGDDELTSGHGDLDAVSASGDTPPTSGTTSTQHLSPTTSKMLRCVRSFSDVSSGLDDDVTPPLDELYARLREVLHENARLKILLWGNKMDPWRLESPITRSKT